MRIQLPSARNLEIYHLLADDGESIREVASEFQLSPSRIVEIEKQVERWYKCAAPEWRADREFRRSDAVALGKRHQERAGRMYSRMMDSFRDSQGEQRHSIETKQGTVTQVRMCHGDPKYLTMALRYSREQFQTQLVLAKLPDEFFEPPEFELVEPSAEELAREAEEERQRLAAEEAHDRKLAAYVQQMQAHAMTASLARGSTAPLPPDPPVAKVNTAAAVASDDGDAASEVAAILNKQRKHDAKRKTSPVQPPPKQRAREELMSALRAG
jgi:hypothetical protein